MYESIWEDFMFGNQKLSSHLLWISPYGNHFTTINI